MQPNAIEQAAQQLSRARIDGVELVELAPDIRPQDEAQAYAVQEALHRVLNEHRAGEIGGYKIGCTTEVMQNFLGIPNPCAGGVFAPTIIHEQGRVAHRRYHHVGVECELAVRLKTDLPGPVESIHHAAAAVESVMAAIEIVDDRWRDYSTISTPTLIADDFFGAGCVLGPPQAGFDAKGLTAVQGAMKINGYRVGEGRGSDILGHPLNALSWLAGCLDEQGKYLQAGQIVLLGSLVQTVWVEPGAFVEVAIAGSGGATLHFE